MASFKEKFLIFIKEKLNVIFTFLCLVFVRVLEGRSISKKKYVCFVQSYSTLTNRKF